MCVCFCHTALSVSFSHEVTFWERADLLVLVCDVSCAFVTFPYSVLGEVWYIIVSILDLCLLSNFQLA